MKTKDYERLLVAIDTLTSKQREGLMEKLREKGGESKLKEVLKSAKPKVCPTCSSTSMVRNGLSRGVQRYRCKACSTTTSSLRDSPIKGLHGKERFERFARCMAEGYPLRRTAEEVGIALSTAFRWRHRFLERMVDHQPQVVEGILEVDETYFRRSRKGERGLVDPRANGSTKGLGRGRSSKHWQAVLVGRGRGNKATIDAVMPRVNRVEVEKVLARHLDPAQTVVCCDGSTAFETITTKLKVPTKVAVASYKTPDRCPTYHVQGVNSYHSELKRFINGHLRGVSTKYLPHYLAWLRMQKWGTLETSANDYIKSAIGIQVVNTF